MKRRAVPTWFLRNLGLDDAVVGDLVEQYQSGRSTRWFCRQALIAAFVMARKHAVLTIGAGVLGWVALWLFFGFVGAPLARLDRYLIANGLLEPFSAAWWLRGAVMWIVVGFPFLASGRMVAAIAARMPLLPVLTFALSVSTTIAAALIFDAGQGNSLDLRMWLGVPLFLTVAPATTIALGGLVAAIHGQQRQ